jgi:coenzyme F420 hydrogenase subunit delta
MSTLKPIFSLHQFPTVNLLAELKEQAKIDIIVLAAQIEIIPDEIRPGLSETMENAVIPACEHILKLLDREIHSV